jgi:hypothetical protein
MTFISGGKKIFHFCFVLSLFTPTKYTLITLHNNLKDYSFILVPRKYIITIFTIFAQISNDGAIGLVRKRIMRGSPLVVSHKVEGISGHPPRPVSL